MKAQTPLTQFSLWRSENFFNIDFACYTLSHHSFPRHFHNHYVIELVLNGADKFYCDGKMYTAYGKQLVLINPGEVHTGSTVADNHLQYYSLYPDNKTLQQVAEAMDITIPANFIFRHCLADQSFLTEKLYAFFNALASDTDTLQQQEIFFECMQELLQQKQAKSAHVFNDKDQRIKYLVDYISTYFRDDISLQQMAALVNLNPFHLVRIFKKTVGISPYDYLLITRTEHAKQLLRAGYQVQEAAITSGFYDSSHLNRSLRRIASTSPKSFLLSKSQYRTIFNR